MLHVLSGLFPGVSFGIYKDDMLALSYNTNGPEQDRLRKDVIRVFQELGFRVTIDVNLKVVNFLDVTLDLDRGKYMPYRKPNDRLSFINVGSSHPPFVFKNMVRNTSERLSRLSSDISVFNSIAPPYNKALRDSGIKESISYIPNIDRAGSKRRRK